MTLALPRGSFIDDDGVFNQLFRRRDAHRPALFLDRDGAIVVGVDYLHRPSEVVIIPGAAQTIKKANQSNIATVIVTNQSGIGRGLFDWPDFIETQDKILSDLAQQGAQIDAVFACPHHPSGNGVFAHPNHPARKPNPGMLMKAAQMLDLDMAASWIIGDSASDIETGRRAGLAGGLHVASGHGVSQAERDGAADQARSDFTVHFADSIADATKLPIFSEPADAD